LEEVAVLEEVPHVEVVVVVVLAPPPADKSDGLGAMAA